MPAIGFQAPLGLSSMPSVSQPFQGKSLSFTVRMNIGECQARNGVITDVLDPGREFNIDVFPLHRVADDRFLAMRGEQRDKLAFQIDALRQAREIAGHQTRQNGVGTFLARAVFDVIGQEALGVEPAGSQPGRTQPAVHGERMRPPFAARRRLQ